FTTSQARIAKPDRWTSPTGRRIADAMTAAHERLSPNLAEHPTWRSLIRAAGAQWLDHKDARLGAALAYYSVFSIGPLILIVTAIAGLLVGTGTVRAQITSTLKDTLGDTGAQAVEAMLAGASRPRDGIIAIAVGIGTLIFAAIGIVVQLKDALNTVWEVKPE